MYRNKVVVVTGGARGIGKSLALAYCDRGATVAVLDKIKPDYEHPSATFYEVDVSDGQVVDYVFKQIHGELGPVHILINNAAIANFQRDIFELTNEEFQRVIGVNLNGAFACSRAFLQSNKGQEYGRIVNIASTRWYQNESGWEAYGASKGGMVSLTHTMAVSLSNTPVTVNAVSPGWIQTTDYEKLAESDHAQHPSGRVGRSEDIVKAVMYVTDPENDFVNGHNLVVDGGMTKRMIYEE